jgi:hypothetical protein
MFCAKCGSGIPEGSKFCQRCGAPAPADTAAAPPPQAPYAPQGWNAPQSGNTPQGGAIPPNTGYIPPQGGAMPWGGAMPGGYGPQGYTPMPPKKKNGPLIAAVILLVLVVILVPIIIILANNPGRGGGEDILVSPAVTNIEPAASGDGPTPVMADDGFRYNYTEILGGGQDKVTVMVYLCGSNLESQDGCATLDLDEMMAADLGSNVNLIIETGGCSSWSTKGIEDGQVQRWEVKDGELVELGNLGQQPMLDPGTLSDFINFSAENYPANRYGLVFWDHGGGSYGGWGWDDIYPDMYMRLSDINAALSSTDVKFDFVGFDACLMGSVETACMLEPYADYLLGSEEAEPAYGWDYTPWLNALGEDPSIDTVELGKIITDSFINQNKEYDDSMLSVVALREIPKVYDELCNYMSDATEALADKEFKTISTAVAHTKEYGDGDFEMIDMGDFAKRADLEGLDTLKAAMESAIKYTNSTTHKGVYGLSMYFPYKQLDIYQDVKDVFASFGYGDDVTKFYDKFVNILAGGQKNSSSRSLKETMTGQEDAQEDYSTYSWYNSSEAQGNTDENIDYSALQTEWDDASQYYYLPLTTEDWSMLTDVQQQILLDDGSGYIDLGSDQYYDSDDAGNLIFKYGDDNTWVAIGGQVVCYYAETTTELDDGTSVFIGYVPAVLNGTADIDIMLEWDGTDANGGYIAGYRLTDEDQSEPNTLGKGYLQFDPGDTVDFICDYYTYDGSYDDSYYFGDTLTIGDTVPTVTYEDVGDGKVLECYMLVDIYQNYSWTEYVEFGGDQEG